MHKTGSKKATKQWKMQKCKNVIQRSRDQFYLIGEKMWKSLPNERRSGAEEDKKLPSFCNKSCRII